MDNNKIKLMIVEDNSPMTSMIDEKFTESNFFEVVIAENDGLKILKKIKEESPDVVIIDIVTPGKDGFGIMEDIYIDKNILRKPKIIIVSALSHHSFISRAVTLGASYYMIKPFDLETLYSRVLSVYRTNTSLTMDSMNKDVENGYGFTKNNKNKIIDEKISNIFITVGIPAHIKGYQFLREAIKMAIHKPEIVNSITKQLYPSIAERFATSSSKVERAIRHAIEVAWNRGRIENINSLFGVKVYSANDKPTNGEFIALVADKMLIEGA